MKNKKYEEDINLLEQIADLASQKNLTDIEFKKKFKEDTEMTVEEALKALATFIPAFKVGSEWFLLLIAINTFMIIMANKILRLVTTML